MVVKGQGKYFDPTFSGSEGTWKRKGYSTDVYTDVAMDWLKARNKKKPFLLSLQFKAPHHEYGMPPATMNYSQEFHFRTPTLTKMLATVIPTLRKNS